MEEAALKSVLETVLLCSGQPLAVSDLRTLFDPELEISSSDIQRQLYSLQQDWAGKGLHLCELKQGWRFQSCPAMQPYLKALTQEKPPSYSRATMETLAIITWKQPVTRGDIEAIRGVAVSSNIIKTLEARGWIETVGHREAPGKPVLWATTRQFLMDLNLGSLGDLPELSTLVDQTGSDRPSLN